MQTQVAARKYNLILKTRSQALVILSAGAGDTNLKEVRQVIEQCFSQANWVCRIYETTDNDNISPIVRQALNQEYELIVAAGSDDTISSLTYELVYSNVPLGIIPVGTGHTLAQELGIPLDLQEACRLLVGKHSSKSLDTMVINEHASLSHISLGFNSLTSNEAKAEVKQQRYGRLASLWAALKQLASPHRWRLMIETDGQHTYHRASLVFLANTGVGLPRSQGGPRIYPDDGQLNICVVKIQTITDFLKIAWQALLGRPGKAPNPTYLTAKRNITIRADKPIPVQADGKTVTQSLVRVAIFPNSIQIIVPATTL